MKKKANLDEEHLSWLIESRAKNQRASLRLLKILRSGSPQFSEGEHAVVAQELVSVAFSLWRAVFLADNNTQGLDHADAFLEKLIVDNAINYAQDRTARNWTWAYYMHNAYFQLSYFKNTRWKNIPLPEFTPGDPRERWNEVHAGFLVAIDELEAELEAKI